MEEKRNDSPKPHKITMSDREDIFISGVEDVESFDEREIILLTSEGNLILEGEDFKINKLSVESGDMEISGFLNSMRYNESVKNGGGFWGKIFK